MTEKRLDSIKKRANRGLYGDAVIDIYYLLAEIDKQKELLEGYKDGQDFALEIIRKMAKVVGRARDLFEAKTGTFGHRAGILKQALAELDGKTP